MAAAHVVESTSGAADFTSAAVRVDPVLVFSSGFLATLAITTVMYLLLAFGVAQIDLPIWVARLFVADPVKVEAVGLAVHLTLGFGFAWIFAALVEPRLTLSPGQNGLLFGAVLWAFVQLIGVPALSELASVIRLDPGPGVPVGWLASRLGIGAAAASLLAHLAYGGTLGFVYGRQWAGRRRVNANLALAATGSNSKRQHRG